MYEIVIRCVCALANVLSNEYTDHTMSRGIPGGKGEDRLPDLKCSGVLENACGIGRPSIDLSIIGMAIVLVYGLYLFYCVVLSKTLIVLSFAHCIKSHHFKMIYKFTFVIRL